MPEVNPSAAAAQAIELFDKDGNGTLNETELATCPGVVSTHASYDTDVDKEVSEDEIAGRLKTIYDSGPRWVTVSCQVLQGSRPLAGAKVRFVPEPFLKDALPPASGTTDNQGRVNPAVVDEQLPTDKKGLHIMRLGVYRVEVEHPSIKQPHKALGCEISELVRGGTEPVIRL